MKTICAMLLAVLLAWPALAAAQEQRFPTPEFKTGYQMKTMQAPGAKGRAWDYIDTAALAAAMGVGAYLVYRRRSRRGMFVLMVLSLAYFGFYRRGCICPIGSIQNVAMCLSGQGYTLPWVVAAFFILPLLFVVFFGRVFCGGVCPLGAIQDVMLWRPLHLPPWLERALGTFAFMYLGLAVLLAGLGTDLVICRYDPFVGFFRLSGPSHLLLIGGVLLVVCMFVGRFYCRFICPYGAILRLLSPLSWKRVSITPKECVDCRLCEESCPFGAIRNPVPAGRAGDRRRNRAVLVGAMVALPVLMGIFALRGYRMAPVLSRTDFRMKLATQVWEETQSGQRGRTDETTAFWKSGVAPAELFAQANALKRRFVIGTTIFGAWVGAVIGFSLISASIRRFQAGYTADSGTCVACARCYLSCPVEHSRRAEAGAPCLVHGEMRDGEE